MKLDPFIEAEKTAGHSVQKTCALFEVSNSAYYQRRNGAPSAREVCDAELLEKIKAIHAESKGTYGAPRVHQELLHRHVAAGKRKVTRLMRQGGLEGRCKKRWRTTTLADPDAEAARDLIQRHFGPCEEMDRRYVGDITYISTWEGWAYLATVIDLAFRRVVGWALADHMRTELVTDALTMAFVNRAPERGVIFHSDRGRQGGINWSSQHEAIYQALFVQSRGALKRELVACLRTGRALRVPRSRTRQKAWGHVTSEVMISERPAEADDRAIPGHWEGDLLIGLERSAIGTLVERTTRFTMLVHLPREEGYRHKHTPKNGPALAGYGAITIKNALAATMTTLPEQLRRSLTWDRGKELSAHAAFKVETGIPVYFADPQSPWQRGSNENTNGLLRQYFPKGTDLSRWNAEEIEAVANALNGRPRKTLGWKTPAEALNEHLLLA